MKEFKFTADAIFMAKNIDDAFKLLSKHFDNLAHHSDKDTSFFIGEMQIAPTAWNLLKDAGLIEV